MALDYSKVVGQEQTGKELVKDPFDLRPAKDTLSLIVKGLDAMVDEANALDIKNDEDAARATEMMAQAKGLQNTLKKKSDLLVFDAYKFYKDVRNLFNSPSQKLSGIITTIKVKFGEYSRQKELARREAEKKAQEEHAKRQERLLKAAEKSGVSKEGLELEKPVLPKKQEPVRTSSGSASVKMELVAEVFDQVKLPPEYLIIEPNMKAINAAVKSGLTDKAWWKKRGVNLVEKAQVRIRT